MGGSSRAGSPSLVTDVLSTVEDLRDSREILAALVTQHLESLRGDEFLELGRLFWQQVLRLCTNGGRKQIKLVKGYVLPATLDVRDRRTREADAIRYCILRELALSAPGPEA